MSAEPDLAALAVASDLDLALELADLAAARSLRRFERRDFQVRTKPDGSPVTEVDVAVERALRERLAQARPDDAIHGEELGLDGAAERRWYLDPIDGTVWFVEGTPRWMTLVALAVGDRIVAGVIDLPALGERWWAAAGHGAFHDGARISVSERSPLAAAVLAEDERDGDWRMAQARPGADHPLARLAPRVARVLASDRDCLLAVADGRADVAVATRGFEWDFAPYAVILAEAGGRFTDLHGVARIDRHEALVSNGRVHDEALAALVDGPGRPGVADGRERLG